MPEYIVDGHGKLIAKTWAPLSHLEHSALEQIELLKDFDPLYRYAAIMPDAHFGLGATIGSVIPADGVLIPSAVGVDIGCGMVYKQSGFKFDDIKDQLPEIVKRIKRDIPVGMTRRTGAQLTRANEYCETLAMYHPAADQLGTLGGGNHFIELQVDTATNEVGVMIHSGSRNYGFQIARRHIEIAKDCMKRWHVKVPKDLDFLPDSSEEGQKYISDVMSATQFAYHNRQLMMDDVQKIITSVMEKQQSLASEWDRTINIHHNYVALEHHFGRNIWVHRKGATRVRKDIVGIIPGSMGTASYLVRGKDNNDSFHSCSHGAGRTMGRKEAKRKLSMDKFKSQMTDIISSDVNESHIDESPDAYKDIDFVMGCQTDLVTITKKLRPIANVKG